MWGWGSGSVEKIFGSLGEVGGFSIRSSDFGRFSVINYDFFFGLWNFTGVGGGRKHYLAH